jgi:predicted double-glycine peptidase
MPLIGWFRARFQQRMAQPVANKGNVTAEKWRTPRRRQRSPRHLSILIHQQEYDYSCVASVLQMLYHYITGRRMSHRRAIKLTRCKPDGAELKSIARIMHKLCGTNSTNLRELKTVKAALRLGIPIIASDETTYEDGHAILLIGSSAKGVYVVDPNTAEINWRTDACVRKSEEFIAIVPEDDQRAEALAKLVARHRRARARHYHARRILFPKEPNCPPPLPVATIRLVPQNR